MPPFAETSKPLRGGSETGCPEKSGRDYNDLNTPRRNDGAIWHTDLEFNPHPMSASELIHWKCPTCGATGQASIEDNWGPSAIVSAMMEAHKLKNPKCDEVPVAMEEEEL